MSVQARTQGRESCATGIQITPVGFVFVFCCVCVCFIYLFIFARWLVREIGHIRPCTPTPRMETWHSPLESPLKCQNLKHPRWRNPAYATVFSHCMSDFKVCFGYRCNEMYKSDQAMIKGSEWFCTINFPALITNIPYWKSFLFFHAKVSIWFKISIIYYIPLSGICFTFFHHSVDISISCWHDNHTPGIFATSSGEWGGEEETRTGQGVVW